MGNNSSCCTLKNNLPEIDSNKNPSNYKPKSIVEEQLVIKIQTAFRAYKVSFKK